MDVAGGIRIRSVVAGLVVAVLLTGLVAQPHASAHPGTEHEPTGLGVVINSPSDLAGFLPAVQWGDTAEVAEQTAELAYAGTGCTPADYAAAGVDGKIALVDSRVNARSGQNECPTYTFVQKVRSAEAAGAIGFVHIPAEGEEPRGNATAVNSGIPALEVERTGEALAVRDRVVAGEAVDATLTNIRTEYERMSFTPCVDGQAGPFACSGVDLLGFVPQTEFNGAGVSDLWGWTDEDGDGGEYVIVGKTNGVAFFDVTDPTQPRYLGELPNPAVQQQVWHDVKVHANHAFVVSESEPHGMRVFDLTRLRDVDAPQVFDADAEYRLNDAAHNLEINTETGFAYIVGGNAAILAPDQCLSGLHMVDIDDPTSPSFAGCYLEEGGPGTAARTVGGPAEDASPAAYVHDTQCVVYRGPDEEHQGKEICFNSAEDEIVVADVSNKLLPVTLGVTSYPNAAYTHQGWLTEDQRYFIVNDELDEQTYGQPTRTLVFDVTDLDDPKLHFEKWHDGSVAITHNNYVHDGYVYQSNYAAGLRVLNASAVADKRMPEVAFFDTFPAHDDTTFDGTWSNYPFFPSGTVAVSGRAEGLFLLRVHDDVLGRDQAGVELSCLDCPVEIRAGERGTAELAVTNTGTSSDVFEITVEGLPAGWAATAEPREVSAAPGETATVLLRIDVPRKQKKGTHMFTVTATSSVDPSVSATEDVEVGVRKGRPSDAGPPARVR